MLLRQNQYILHFLYLITYCILEHAYNRKMYIFIPKSYFIQTDNKVKNVIDRNSQSKEYKINVIFTTDLLSSFYK